MYKQTLHKIIAFVLLSAMLLQPGSSISWAVEPSFQGDVNASTQTRLQDESGEPWKLPYNEPVVSTFSGAIVYNYPINVPPGRGGLQPRVNLSYNSRRVDGILSWTNHWAGVGWTVDLVDVVRDRVERCFSESVCMSDRFYLLINGTGYDLEPAEGITTGYPGRYYAEDAPQLYVEFVYDENAPNRTKTYWIVRMPDGTTYQVGYSLDAEQTLSYVYEFACSNSTYRWRLNKISDVHDNEVLISYREQNPSGLNNTASVLSEIWYNPDDQGQWTSKIIFEGSEFIDFTESIFIGTGKLERITVENGGQVSHYYEIEPGFQPPEYGSHGIRHLASITQFNADGSQALPPTSFEYAFKPNKTNCHNPETCTPYQLEAFNFPRLVRVDNGYGAVDEFSYEDDGRADNNDLFFSYRVTEQRTYNGISAQPTRLIEYDYGTRCYNQSGAALPPDGVQCRGRESNGTGPLVGHDVVTQTIKSQSTDDPALRQSVHRYYIDDYNSWRLGREYQTQIYSADGKRLQQTDIVWGLMPLGPINKAYVGQNTSTDYTAASAVSHRADYSYDDYGNVLSEYHYGAEARLSNPGFEAGEQDWTLFGDPSPASVITQTWAYAGCASLQLQGPNRGGAYQEVEGLVPGETYVVRALVLASEGNDGQFRLWLHDTGDGPQVLGTPITPTNQWQPVSLTYTLSATDKLRLHLHYYTPGHGTIYVDQVAVARARDVGDEHSIHRAYYPNESAWIVNAPAWQNTFAGISLNLPGGGAKRQTFNYYDNAVDYQTPPTVGELTKVSQGHVGVQLASSEYRYDQWGNLSRQTDPNGNVSIITYDDVYHKYPITTCNGMDTEVEQCRYSEYYGVNGPAVTTPGAHFGSLYRNWGANGKNTATYQYYDAFGRPVKVVRPGDTFEMPTLEYRYSDSSGAVTPPFEVEVYQRQVSGEADQVHATFNYYDGLGRLIQSRSETVDGVQQSVSHVEYDALGREVERYLPVFEDFGGYVPAADLESLAHTSIYYDALDRVVRQEEPDGTPSNVIYGDGLTLGEDALGRVNLSYSDAFGQLIAVDETLRDWRDDFEGGNLDWDYCGDVTQVSGTLHLMGNGSDWNTQITGTHPLGDDQAVLFEFKYDPGSVASALYVERGQWPNATYRRWGLDPNGEYIYWHAYQGTENWMLPLLPLQNDVWYRALLRIEDDGEFVAAVWQRDDPTQSGVMRMTPGASWAGYNDWVFRALQYDGGLYLDSCEGVDVYSTHYSYDVLGNLTEVEDALGNLAPMQYDFLGRKTWMDDPDLGQRYYQYDDGGNLIAQVDANQQAINLYYDPLNRLVGKTYVSQVSDPAGYERPVDPGYAGYEVTYRYDESGHGYGAGLRTSMQDPSGTTAWDYDERGRVIRAVKIVGTRTYTSSYAYDAMDRPVAITYPDGELVTTIYDDAGQPQRLTSETHSQLLVQSASYNAMGQPSEMLLGSGAVTRWGYWGQEGDWDCNGTSFQNYGRLWRIRSAGPTGTPLFDQRYVYNVGGNVRHVVDAPLTATDWPTQTTFRDGFDTQDVDQWSWSAGQTVPFTHSGNNVVRSVGTGQNWDTQFHREVFDLTDGKGLELRFKLDHLDAEAHFSVESNDGVYRRFGLRAKEAKLSLEYADNGSNYRYPSDLIADLSLDTWYVLRIVVDDTPGQGFYLQVYQQDDPSLGGSYQLEMPPGREWRFHHWIYQGTAYIDDYAEFDAGQVQWQSNQALAFEYDTLDRLKGVSPLVAGAGYSATYDYDPIGNLSSRTVAGQAWSYDYAGAGGPHAVTSLSDGSSFEYDANGNMTGRIGASGSYSQVFDVENRLVEVIERESGQRTEFVYDGDGRRVLARKSDGATTWYPTPGYEEEIRFIVLPFALQAVYASSGVSLTWRPDPAPAATTYNVYRADSLPVPTDEAHRIASGLTRGRYTDAEGHIEDYYVVTALDETGESPPSDAVRPTEPSYELYLPVVRRPAMPGPNRLGSKPGGVQMADMFEHVVLRTTYALGGQAVAVRVSGELDPAKNGLFFLHTDHLGSNSLMSDADGQAVAGGQARYLPYGGYRIEPSADLTDQGFTGHKHNDEVGLIFMNARYYDPALGRFISADTIVPEPGNPQSLNRYAYVLNNPLKYNDPTGHQVEQDWETAELPKEYKQLLIEEGLEDQIPELTSQLRIALRLRQEGIESPLLDTWWLRYTNTGPGEGPGACDLSESYEEWFFNHPDYKIDEDIFLDLVLKGMFDYGIGDSDVVAMIHTALAYSLAADWKSEETGQRLMYAIEEADAPLTFVVHDPSAPDSLIESLGGFYSDAGIEVLSLTPDELLREQGIDGMVFQ